MFEKTIEILLNVIVNEHKKSKSINPDLFRGNMGICLAIYLLNKRYKNALIEEYADMLLEKTVRNIRMVQNPLFDQGLSGIGWGLNLLHSQSCIDGDINEILSDIDAHIYKSLCEEKKTDSIDNPEQLIGILIYIVSRIKNESLRKDVFLHRINEASLRVIVNKLESRMPPTLEAIYKDYYHGCLWEYPLLLFCAGETMRTGVYADKVRNLLNEWSFYICGQIPYYNVNRLALANSLSYVNSQLRNERIESYTDLLYYSINFDSLLNEANYHVININEGWFYSFFCVHVAQKLMKTSHPKYEVLEPVKEKMRSLFWSDFESYLNNLPQEGTDITLIGGLSGIALLFALVPDIFNE